MIRAIIRNAGFRPLALIRALLQCPSYLSDRRIIKKLAQKSDWHWGKELPILLEKGESAGNLGAYFLQDQIVARWLYEDQPKRHIDVGSRIDGFVGSVSVFREIEVLDIRVAPGTAHNIIFHQLNLMDELPEGWRSSTDSLSCLHTIEHFGLGRYGDPLDIDGHLKGLQQLKKMLKPGGRFYLSTPMGPQRIEFNAHRIFSAETILNWFNEGWRIERFAYIDDQDGVHESVDWKAATVKDSFGCRSGVAIIAAIRESEDLSR
jgi:SAM-dependent methyltransferase